MNTRISSFGSRLGNWARAHPRLLGASVIVGALALTGIAVVTASTLFSGLPVAGEADPTPSPSASASAAPSATPSPQPSASALPLASAEPTPIPGPEWPPVGDPSVESLLPRMWTVAVVNELNIRSGPGTEHPAIGQLNAGDIAQVLEVVDLEWVRLAADGAIGYVNAGPRGDRYLLATKTPWESSFKGIAGVATDGEAYLAYGSELAVDYPYPLEGVPGFALRSTDGVSWTPITDGLGWSVQSVSPGETGWVAITVLAGPAVSFSSDGVSWDEPVRVGTAPMAVAYGPAGWVLFDFGGQTWTSTDGRTWDGPHQIGLGSENRAVELEASTGGYVAFDRLTDRLWTSADGVTWTSVDHVGQRVSDAELVVDRLHVVLVDAESATTVFRGTLSTAGFTWDGSGPTLDPDDNLLHVDRITQAPDGLLAIGWDETELLPVTWRSPDGTTWERVPPGEQPLQGVGLFEPVWGPAGWVGPGLERSTDGESWLPSEYSLAYDGPVPPCPPGEEVSTIALAYLGPYAERCLGDASIIIRGYVPVASGFGGCCPPNGEPGWLAGNYPGAILATGDPGVPLSYTYQLGVYLPPDLDDALFQVTTSGRWVEVVGHYRDPASASCVSRPRSDFPNPLAPHEDMRALCRERFVVESVIEADGP